jgi:beta-1,4-mannosyltransferase
MRILVDHLDRVGGNPYLKELYDRIRADFGADLAGYSPGSGLRGTWDVVHFNWPEWSVRRNSGSGLLAFDSARLLADIALLKSRGATIAWTAHNIRPHECDSWGIVDRLTTSFSYLVDTLLVTSQSLADELQRTYPALRNADHHVVPHSHYRGVYPDARNSRDEARTTLGLPLDKKIVLSFGLIRPFKNVPTLLRCMQELAPSRPDAFLLVAGPAPDARLAQSITGALAGLDRARGDLRFVPDAEVQHYLRAADAVIISTSLSVNSGTAMLALSFDRPVMLPHRSTFAEMAETLGPGWVQTYDGGIRPHVLARAFDLEIPDGSPNLEAHDPGRIARLTYHAFEAGIAVRQPS